MIVHRLLDLFFRTLNTADAVRDRLDRALGREPTPDPWAVKWPEGAEPTQADSPPAPSPQKPDDALETPRSSPGSAKKTAAKKAPKKTASRKKPVLPAERARWIGPAKTWNR